MLATKRLMKEYKILKENKNVVVQFDESNIYKLTVFVTGPLKTPYENGIFQFMVDCGNNYPIKPPNISILTTNNGTIRFNPNFYANGKLCVSMLGTWGQTTWNPVLQIETILLSIQSMMTEDPYHNEPGHEQHTNSDMCGNYAAKIRHEVIRIAIIQSCKHFLQMKMGSDFLRKYIDIIPNLINECNESLKIYKDGVDFFVASFESPSNGAHGRFMYTKLIEQLENLKIEIIEHLQSVDTDTD